MRKQPKKPMTLAKGFAIMSALAGSLTLLSCVSTTNLSVPAACKIFRPIQWDQKDTDLTIEGVKMHNAIGKSLCGWTAADLPTLPSPPPVKP